MAPRAAQAAGGKHMVAQTVSVLEQDHLLALHLLGRHGGGAAQGVVGGKGGQQLVVLHVRPRQAGHIVGQSDEGGVQGA